MTDIEKINYIADHYGFISQREMLIEECAELIQAIQKLKRLGDENEKVDNNDEFCDIIRTRNAEKTWTHFIEELADVKIMIMQMEHFITPYSVDVYENMITSKLDRQIDRIEKAKQQEKEDYHKWRKGVTA